MQSIQKGRFLTVLEGLLEFANHIKTEFLLFQRRQIDLQVITACIDKVFKT